MHRGGGVVIKRPHCFIRAVLFEVGAAQVRVVGFRRARNRSRARHRPIISRLVTLRVPVIRQTLGVDFLPRRGKAGAGHGALHHRVWMDGSGVDLMKRALLCRCRDRKRADGGVVRSV